MYPTFFISFPSLYFDHSIVTKKHDMQIMHYHECWEIFYVADGKRYLFLDNIRYELLPGDFFITKPYEIHYSQSLDSTLYEKYVLNFTPKDLSPILTDSEIDKLLTPLQSGVYHFSGKDASSFLALVSAMEENFQKPTRLSKKIMCSLCFLLLSLLREAQPHYQTIPLNPDTNIRPEIQRAISYINQNYQRTISLEELAEFAHLSKYYFCREFRNATNMTFLEYQNSVRLSKAHPLLLDPSISLSEVSRLAGFSSYSQFIRVFTKNYQVSPKQFRTQSKTSTP